MTAELSVDRRSVWRALDLAGLVVLALAWAYFASQGRSPGYVGDDLTYWQAWHGPMYTGSWLVQGAYSYSPAAAQAYWPLAQLSFPVFHSIVAAAQLAALAWIARPALAAVILLVPVLTLPSYGNPVLSTIQNGNIQILLAAAIVAGFRWPATWAFVLLTKVTPGVGLLWFAVRREWRSLGVALGVTTAISLVSFALAPDLWREWFGLLMTASGTDTLGHEPFVPQSLAVRLPIAAVVVMVGAIRGWRWTVPIAAMLALPAIQLGGLALAVGAVPLLRSAAGLRRADGRLVGPVGPLDRFEFTKR